MQCPSCNKEINDNAVFCPQCGQPVGSQAAAQTPDVGGVAQNAVAVPPATGSPTPMGVPSAVVAPVANTSKNKKTILVVVVVALAVVACAIGGAAWWKISSDAAAKAAAEQAQADALKNLHEVKFSVTAPNWTNGSTRIPVAVVGTDATGATVDQVQFVDGGGTGLALAQGTYTVSFPASPLLENGQIYQDNETSIQVTVGEDLEIDQPLEIQEVAVEFVPADPATVTDDQINRAEEYAQKDTAENATDKVPALKDNAVAVRDQAVAEANAPQKLAAQAYRQAVSQIGTYDFGQDFSSISEQSYALVDMNADGLPELLLQQTYSTGLEHIKVLTYDVSAKTLINTSDVLEAGVAPAGGFRGSISSSLVANGLLLSQGNGMNGYFTTYRVLISGNSLTRTEVETYRIGENTTSVVSQERADITWYDVTDNSALTQLENTK